MSKALDKLIDEIHKKLINAEDYSDHEQSESKQRRQQQQDPEIERRKLQILEIGKLTAEYEDNLTFQFNRREHLTNTHNIILEPQSPKYFNNSTSAVADPYYNPEIEERISQEIQDYEDTLATATNNAAAKAGGLHHNSHEQMKQFAQYCKRFYLIELEKAKTYQKNIKTLIGYKHITIVNQNTNEVVRYDHELNLL
jgi:hypothetical protein